MLLRRALLIPSIAPVLLATLSACIPDDPPPAPAAAAVEAAPTAAGKVADGQDEKGLLKAVESMKAEIKDRPRDFGINLALGNLFYDNGRYVEALEYYRDAERIAAEVERALISTKDRPAAKKTPESCRPEDESAKDGRRSFEKVAEAVKALSDASSPEAVACLRQLAPRVAQLHARQGNAWYLVGNGDKAREAHEAALAIDPDEPEALFFRGAHILENAKGDEAKLSAGRAEWEHLLRVAPDHPRATIVRETMPRIDELFGAKAVAKAHGHGAGAMAGHPPIGEAPQGDGPMAGPGPLPAGMAEAMQKTPMTPELAKSLDQKLADGDLLLAKGEWQAALDTFKGVMPLRPDGRVALGMGVALRELGKPTAERVLLQATRMPGGDAARAQYELGRLYETTQPAKARETYEAIKADPTWGRKASERLAAMK